ncbi:hypothetical protein [Streptosporangium sp. NPDC051022]|uniref:hypothetical protein n=1 Tax=Streptosporangium sp. NPDC051022 TaxID=3155752 RepID=UPI003419AB8A
MADLILSAERHSELAELLDDEQRLQAEYPKVAEYLDMAVRLSGTGDVRADHAFDLRFIHYMTGGDDVSEDPYWEIVGPSVSGNEGRRLVNGGKPEGSPRLAFAQIILQAVYAYAVPSPETVQWISRFCDGGPVVELGAGRGYWAKQLARAGVIVNAYDSEPPDRAQNASFRRSAGQADVWHPVEDLEGFTARVSERPTDTVLFLCWPPGWGASMASSALASFEALGGERLVFVGQSKGGQTGDDAFFDRLAANWTLESVDRDHVSWWNSVDVAQAWVRA